MTMYPNWLVWILQLVLPRRWWYREYYLYSKHWRATRLKKLNSVGWKCERCRRSGLSTNRRFDVHHKVYHLWHEKLSDLEVLCREHHQKEHNDNRH